MKIEKDFRNKLTAKDYINYLLTRNMILLLSPVLIVALLIAVIGSIIKDGFTFVTVIYLLPIILFIASYIQMYRVIKQTLKAQREMYELKIALTDNEYIDISNGIQNSLDYKNAYCYKETKNYLYLFVDQYNALILPKREFESNELSKIKETLSKSITKKPIYNFSSLLLVVVTISLVSLIVSNLM